MWSKRLTALVLCLLLLASCFPALGAEEEEPAYVPLQLSSGSGDHTPFFRGYGDGTVRPDALLTAAEGCQLFYSLLKYRPADRAEVPGVSKNAWYYNAVSLLAARGIWDLQRDGQFLPDAALTRGQFVLMLTRFYPELEEGDCAFPDVPYGSPWRAAVSKAVGQGWIKGYEDGTFRPMDTLTRAEAATVFCRVLGRHGDEAFLAEKAVLPIFTDLGPDHWAYSVLLEAAIPHTAVGTGDRETWTDTTDSRLRFTPGPVFANGETYWAGEDGFLCRDLQVGELTFGPDGRYTCGDEEADAYVKDILAGLYDPTLSREELLRLAFNYVRDSFAYLRRSESYEYGATGWETAEALTILRTGRGNCYCYAGAFALLARQLGYDAHAIAGASNWTPRPHAWVEIDFDGVTYIFDTELEMAKKGQYNFWKITPAELPWPYWKDEETRLYGD